MNLREKAGVEAPTTATRGSVRYAWIGWAALFLVIAGIIISGTSRTVVPSYRIAAGSWIAGQGLYNGDGIGGFVYLPQAAVLYIPFALFSPVAGEVLWRFAMIAVFAAGLRGFARLAGEKAGKELFPLMTLAAIPLVWDCARNGQSTLIMTGMMLLAVVDVARGHPWRATLWLSLSLALKPLAIVLVLLVMAVERPMTWRAAVGVAVTALFPFLVQHPAYVVQQYAAFLNNTAAAAHVAVVAHGWTSPFTALRIAGVNVPEKIQTIIRIVAALGTLAVCIIARRRHDTDGSAAFVFSLAAAYLILFSPRTENNTYAMLGPSIALFLSRTFLVEKRRGEGILLSCIALAMTGSRVIEHLIAPHAEPIWLSPLLAVCFTVYVIVRIFTGPAKDPEPAGLSGRQKICCDETNR